MRSLAWGVVTFRHAVVAGWIAAALAATPDNKFLALLPLLRENPSLRAMALGRNRQRFDCAHAERLLFRIPRWGNQKRESRHWSWPTTVPWPSPP